MTPRRVLPWVVGALAVLALAVGGVFANLAVLRSGEADAAIGTLSAKGIAAGEAPATLIPAPHVDAITGGSGPGPVHVDTTPDREHHPAPGHRDADD